MIDKFGHRTSCKSCKYGKYRNINWYTIRNKMAVTLKQQYFSKIV